MRTIPSTNTAAGSSLTRCYKNVTPRKLDANRRNARSSTGPRTERGKSNSRFNAVTLGLFAKHVPIPFCDGDEAKKDFQMLLDEMLREFQPVGTYEEWLVVKITESMWRLRRATRCESGIIRNSAIPRDDRHGMDLVLSLAGQVCSLTQAEEQLRTSGTLSGELYAKVESLVTRAPREQAQLENEKTPVRTEFDPQEVLGHVSNEKAFLESFYAVACDLERKKDEIRSDCEALVPEPDMDRILRYEERMHRHIDWAVQRRAILTI